MFKGLLLSGVILFSFQAWGQSTDVVEADQATKMTVEQSEVTEKKQENKKDKASNKGVEKIEVTGSYVRRIDIEGPSPIVTIDKEDFEVAGVDTVTDYMRESPMFSGTGDSGDRDGYFNFRGQHPGSTLILINGMRVPKLGGGGSNPDRGFFSGVGNIPTNVIERVEVLKDGSSALYGSDAMAGVMNFITKKDYDGAEYSTRVNVPEIGQGLQQNHSLAFGKSYSRGSWFLTTQFVEQRGYTEKDVNSYRPGSNVVGATSNKEFTSLTQNAQGGFDAKDSMFYRANCADPSERNCPENDTRGMDFIRDPRQNIGALASGRYDVNSDVSVAFLGMYNRRQRMDYGTPQYLNFNRQSGQQPFNTSVFKSSSLKQQTQGSNFGEMAIQPIDEVGMREVAVLQNTYSAQTKIEGFYLDTWKWDLQGSYAYSTETRDHRNGLVDMDIARGVIENSSSWSLAGSNRGAFDDARVQGVEGYEASMTTARMVTSGELFNLGGPVSMAVGVEGQWETTGDTHDAILQNSNLNVQFFPNQRGTRNVNSQFIEFVAYPTESVEVQMAGRSDTYSDFGTTFNPKLSVGFRPNNTILLRSSVGSNFNAPSVRNMIQQDYVEFQRVEFCPPGVEDCDETTIPVTRYRDPGLRPEEGVNYNFGTVIQPNKNWTFTFDQWNFEGQGMLAKRSGSNYSDLLDALNGDEQALKDQAGVSIIRNSAGEPVSALFPAVRNMGTRVIRGIDFNVAFDSPIRFFGRVLKFGANFDHTHMLIRKTKYTESSDFRNYGDMEWKNTSSLNLRTQRHSYRFAARTLPGDTGSRSDTRTQTMYDINYTYKVPYWAGKFQLGVKNLLNDRPNVDQSNPLIDFTAGFNASQFQALGRRYYVGYSHTF